MSQLEFTEYQVDPDNSERIPSAHWEVYLSNKVAYLADPQAAVEAFNAPKPAPAKTSKPQAGE